MAMCWRCPQTGTSWTGRIVRLSNKDTESIQRNIFPGPYGKLGLDHSDWLESRVIEEDFFNEALVRS